MQDYDILLYGLRYYYALYSRHVFSAKRRRCDSEFYEDHVQCYLRLRIIPLLCVQDWYCSFKFIEFFSGTYCALWKDCRSRKSCRYIILSVVKIIIGVNERKIPIAKEVAWGTHKMTNCIESYYYMILCDDSSLCTEKRSPSLPPWNITFGRIIFELEMKTDSSIISINRGNPVSSTFN